MSRVGQYVITLSTDTTASAQQGTNNNFQCVNVTPSSQGAAVESSEGVLTDVRAGDVLGVVLFDDAAILPVVGNGLEDERLLYAESSSLLLVTEDDVQRGEEVVFKNNVLHLAAEIGEQKIKLDGQPSSKYSYSLN